MTASGRPATAPTRRSATTHVRVRPQRAAELVANHLRTEIVSGKLATGRHLPVERELIEAYGVSRPTLREALRILETEGLLEVTRGMKGGAKVLGPSLTVASHAFGMILQARRTRLADVQVARSIIEPPAARMVAERRTDEDIASLRAALDAERDVLGTPEFAFAAMRFHEELVRMSGNETISAFLQVLHDIHEGAATMFSSGRLSAQSRATVMEQHEQLLQHIVDGDGDAAETLWKAYWEAYTTDAGTAVVDVLAARR